jgi:hypothetical protein
VVAREANQLAEGRHRLYKHAVQTCCAVLLHVARASDGPYVHAVYERRVVLDQPRFTGGEAVSGLVLVPVPVQRSCR